MGKSYWERRKDAFGYAFKGLIALFRGEAHAKIHLLAAVCAVTFGFIYDISQWEWCAIIICIGAVISAEAFNTAIEHLADRITKDKDPLIGAAKDVAAAAVLLLAIVSVVVGLIIFIPHFT